MAHVKRVCARFLRAVQPLITSRDRTPRSQSLKGPRTPLLLLICNSCLFRVSPQGQIPRPHGDPGNQKHVTNLCPTEARIFLQRRQ